MLAYRLLATLALGVFLSFQSSCGGDDSDHSTGFDYGSRSDRSRETSSGYNGPADAPILRHQQTRVIPPSQVGRGYSTVRRAPAFQPSDVRVLTRGCNELIWHRSGRWENLRARRGRFDAQGRLHVLAAAVVRRSGALIGENIVSPGLINAHDHIGWIHQPPAQWGERFEHRHDWRKGKRGHSRSALVRAVVPIRRLGANFASS